LTFYLDTSVLVAVLIAETHSESAKRWLYAKGSQEVAASAWTRTELYSALALKVRTGRIDTFAQGRGLGG
jgi:hypothetical protein